MENSITREYFIELSGNRYPMSFATPQAASDYWADHLSKVVVPETWKDATIVCRVTTVEEVLVGSLPQANNTSTWEAWNARYKF